MRTNLIVTAALAGAVPCRAQISVPFVTGERDMIDRTFLAFLLLFLILVGGQEAQAQNCTSADFGAVVDQTAQALRDLNRTGSKRYQTKLTELREKRGASAAEELQDETTAGFDREIESLVTQLDVISQTPNSKINCEKLDELKRGRDRLLTVMSQKSGYLLAKIESKLVNPSPSDLAKVAEPDPANSKPQSTAGTKPPATELKSAAAEPKPAAVAGAKSTAAGADYLPPNATKSAPAIPARVATGTTQAEHDLPPPAPLGDERRQEALAPPSYENTAPQRSDGALRPTPVDDGYSIADIREAGRGVLGTINAEFGAAINYAFQQFGQPNAYIAGGEGGGALLAGLRYGAGTLYRKTERPTAIYWQGPSAGLDFGAEGGQTLFLVYNLDNPHAIYGRFGGIGAAVYLAGGIGLNVLGKDGVIIVPIRTGLGYRFGANLAYVKFTEHQTWNPF